MSNPSNILDAIQGAAAILDKNGEILTINSFWEKESRNSSWFPLKPDSSNYLHHFQNLIENGNDYALRLLIGIREVLNNDRDTFRITISSGSSSKKWFKANVSAFEEDEKRYALIIFDNISDSMKIVQSLRESEAKYRYQFKYSTSGIILGKPDGEILDVNPVACKILGYTKKELLEGGRSLIVDESDPAHLEVVRIREEQSIFEGEKVYKHKEGHFIPVHMTSVIHMAEDESQQIINTFHDLRDEKASKFTLEEERRFSRTALNSIPGIFFVINSEGQFVRWNDALLSQLGYKESEFMKLQIVDVFKNATKSEIKTLTQQAFATGHSDFIGEIATQKGSSRTYNVHFNKFESHRQAFLVATGVDITDLLESEKKREKNYRLLTELFSNTPIAIVQINPDYEVQRINAAFTKLFGFTEKEILGKNVDQLIATKHQYKEADGISRGAFNGMADQRKTIRYSKNKRAVPVLITTVPVRSNGDIIAVYGMYVDLTEQTKLEKNLQRSLTEKEILLQEVHHRVKNNLAIIASLLELQLIHDKEKDPQKQLTEAHDRIYSIAKIHESLYNRTDIAEISFDDYLTSLIEAMPKLIKAKDFKDSSATKCNNLMLNINQAVPLGLLINELVNLGSYGNNNEHFVELSYKTEGAKVTLVMSGIEHQYEELNTQNSESTFQNLLIKTFIDQIEANIDVEKNRSDKVFIKFQKSEKVNGSSHSFIHRTENPPKSNIF